MKIDPARFLFLAQALSAAAVAAGSAGACSSGTVGSDNSSSGTSGSASGTSGTSSGTSTSSGTPGPSGGTSGRPANSDGGAPAIPESTPAPAPPPPPPKQDAGPSTTLQCPGESGEPNSPAAYRGLPQQTDCDDPRFFDSAKSGTLDSDSFYFFGKDTVGLCQVAPKFWINNPSMVLYVQMYCQNGAIAIQNCGTNGSPLDKGCVTTAGSPAWMAVSIDCPGEDDSASVWMDVYPASEGETNECRPYQIWYEF